MEDSVDDTIVDIVSYMEATSAVRFLSTTKRFWKLRTRPNIDARITPYSKHIKYKQWNKGLLEATNRNNFPQIVFFVEQGANEFSSPLGKACFNGNKALVNYFIELGADDWRGAMYQAANGGHKQLVEIILQKSYECDLDEIGLRGASEGGHIELVRYFVERVGSNTVDALFSVIQAAKKGHIEIIELLLKVSVPSESVFRLGLREACKGGNLQTVEYFWNKHPSSTSSQEDAFSYAVEGGQDHIIQWLEEKNVRCYDKGLEAAAKGGHINLVHRFYEEGSKNRDLALEAAAKEGHLDIVKYLIERGATEVNKALAGACEQDHREVIEYLIAKGANSWKTCFNEACTSHNVSLAEYLFPYGQRDNVLDTDYLNSLLESIARWGSSNIVLFLVDHGANNLQQALQEAQRAYNFDVADALKEKIKATIK